MTPETDTDGPEPACNTQHNLDRNEWVLDDDLTERTLIFRRGCKRCYPGDEEPEPGDTVVYRKYRGSAQPKLHKPDSDHTNGP